MTERPTISRRLLLAGLRLAASSSAWAQQVRGAAAVIRQSEEPVAPALGPGQNRWHAASWVSSSASEAVLRRRRSISYAPDVPVRIDGEPVSAKALRIGHHARSGAVRQANGTLTTRGIDAVSEVIRPIETVRTGENGCAGPEGDLGRSRRAGAAPAPPLQSSGCAGGGGGTDGVIVASLVEKRRDTATRVAGLLERDRDGLRVGGLRPQGMRMPR